MSKKTAKTKRETDPFRLAYVEAADSCEYCELKNATECHEIPAGKGRQSALCLPNTWLALCPDCHRELQSLPVELQFGVKIRAVSRDINHCLGRNAL